MSGLFYATGLVFWAIVAVLMAAWLINEMRMMCIAADWCVWAILAARRHKSPVTWSKLPKTWWRRYREFAGPWAGHTWTSSEGYWKGFRQWEVYPRDPSTRGGA